MTSTIFTKRSKIDTRINSTNDSRIVNPNILESASDDPEEDREHYETILCLSDIKKSIPDSATDQPDPVLSKTLTEWRWRFFDVEGRKLIEISRKEPNNDRFYIDNTRRWTRFTLDASWNRYIVDAKYYYAN